jgi:DNA anti-recombination protein RmuC
VRVLQINELAAVPISNSEDLVAQFQRTSVEKQAHSDEALEQIRSQLTSADKETREKLASLEQSSQKHRTQIRDVLSRHAEVVDGHQEVCFHGS